MSKSSPKTSAATKSAATRHRTVLLQGLEPRTLLATPGSPRPESLPGFDKGERTALIDRMDHLASQATFKAKIGTGTTSNLRDFDNALLGYMHSRSNVNYYFTPGSQASHGAFITNSLSYSKTVEKANQIVDSRLFPATPTTTTYAVTAGGNINYRAPNGEKGTTFSQTMNRFEYWGNLADAAWLTGNQGKYTDEVSYQLAQWSSQFDGSIAAPGDWNDAGKSGWDFFTSIRAESWTQAYFKLLSPDNASWNGADNTLMLYKLMQHGDYLYNYAQSAKIDASADSNKTITLAKSLYSLGRMFPELDTAAAWEAKGRTLLIDAMNAQIYADGSHREQSPAYTLGVAEDLLDVYFLDKKNGDAAAWSGAAITTLNKIVESYRQFLTPDGRRPGTGDTYRNLSVGLFLKAGVILDKISPTSTTLSGSYGTGDASISVANATGIDVGDVLTGAGRSELIRVTGKSGNTLGVQRGVSGTAAQTLSSGATIYNLGDQPFAKPSVGDVWLLGQAVTTPFLNVPATPEGVLGNRGKTYAMTDSGNYIVRSGNEDTATQITFDAGPKGGFHGHHDLLNFELWSGGRPLIIDPGPYKYDGGAEREYAISTKAHNTINVDGKNVGWVEGEKQPAIIASHSFGGSSATLTGTHFAYSWMDGQPAITRSIWYNYGDTMVVVDWGEAASSHTFQQSFNIPGSAEAGVSGATGGTQFKTSFASGGNVRVKTINGGSLVKGGLTWVTGEATGDYKDDAYRYTVSKTGNFAVFVTLINVYTGLSVPNVDATILTSNPQPGQAIQVQLTRNGVAEQTIGFQQPAITRPAANLNLNSLVSDMGYDKAGNLHVAYQDLTDGHLKYAVKNAATGKWSPVQVIDNSANGVGAQIDLAFDNENRPAVAYYDSFNGDLKYAILSTQNNAWRSQTVDSRTTVGQNPSLVFSRKGNSAIISYYNRTKGDLKLATQQNTTEWSVTTFDDSGDVGRFSQLALDPNRTELNARYVIAYEDRTNAAYKYAYYSGSSWKYETVKGRDITATGGYMSLAFQDSGSGTTSGVGGNRFVPRFTFYENSPDYSLWLATKDKDSGAWSTKRIDGTGSTKKVGAYNQLSYASGKAEIFYFDDRNNQLRRAVSGSGSTWSYYTLGTGGREVRIARKGTQWSVVGFDTTNDDLLLSTV